MEVDSKDEPTSRFSLKTLSRPRFILTAWFVGYWFAMAGILCYVDHRKIQNPADALSTNLYIICYHTCLAQMLVIFCLAFFSPQRHWLLSPLLGIAGAISTLAIFRIFNSTFILDAWPFFAAYPAVFFLMCLVNRIVVSLIVSRSEPRKSMQIAIVDVLLLTFVAACFLSLVKIAIFDLNHVLWDDPKKIYAFHPEVTGRLFRAIDLSAAGLILVALTRVRNSLANYLLLIPLAICFCAAMSLAIHYGISIFDGREAWESALAFRSSLQAVAFNAFCFFVWFGASIAFFRGLGLLPKPPKVQSPKLQIH